MTPIIYDGGAWPSELSGTSNYVLYSVAWNKASQSLCVKEESPADFRTVTKIFGAYDSFDKAYAAAEEAAQRMTRFRDDVLINSKEYNLTHLQNDPTVPMTKRLQLGLVSNPPAPKREEAKQSYWAEVRNDYNRTAISQSEGDLLAVTSIDAWKGIGDDEEGEVIARVLLSKSGDVIIDYIDWIAETDVLAQEAIQEAVSQMKEWYREITPEKESDVLDRFFIEKVKWELEHNYEDCYQISEETLNAILSNEEALDMLATAFEVLSYEVVLDDALDQAVHENLGEAIRMCGIDVGRAKPAEPEISEENRKQAEYIRSLMVTSELEPGFKSYDLFENHPDKVCYIPENWDFEFDGPGITGQDIIDQCGGDKIKARMVFDMCHWQFPSSVLGEWDRDDERALQDLKTSMGIPAEKGSPLDDKIRSINSKQEQPHHKPSYHNHTNPKPER